MPDSQAEYPVRHVAFLDLLGFTNKVMRIGDDPQRFRAIQQVLQLIRTICAQAEQGLPIENWNTIFGQIKTTTFSDCLVVSTPAESARLVTLVDTINWFCRALLAAAGSLPRGGICTGRLYHQDNIVFGEGLVRAYHLEKDVAKLPRVVVDPATVEQWERATSERILSGNKHLVVRDSDGIHMLDPFYDINKETGPDKEFYALSSASLQSMLDEPGLRLGDWAKVVWIAERFNVAAVKIGQSAVRIPSAPRLRAE